MDVDRILALAANKFPERVAILFENQLFTYGEFSVCVFCYN
jgi:hypothetical protein